MHDPRTDPTHAETVAELQQQVVDAEQRLHQAEPQLSGDPAVDTTVERITGVPAPQGPEGVRTQAAITNDAVPRVAPGEEPKVGKWVVGQGLVPLDPTRPLPEGEQRMVSDQQEILKHPALAGDRDPEIDLDLTDAADFDTTGLRQAPGPEQVTALRIGTALDPIRHVVKPTMGDIRDADNTPLPFEVDAGEFIRAGAHLFNAIYYLPAEEAQPFFNAMPPSVLRAYARAQHAFLPHDAPAEETPQEDSDAGITPLP